MPKQLLLLFGLSLLFSSNLFGQDTITKKLTFKIEQHVGCISVLKPYVKDTICSVWVAGYNTGTISRDDIKKASGLTVSDGCGELKLIGYDASFVLPANKDTNETKTYHSKNASFTGPMRRVFKNKVNYIVTFGNIMAVSPKGDTVKLNSITLRVFIIPNRRIGGARFI